MVVEAHTMGQDDWTTLEEVNGGTTDDVGASCDINWDTLHPFLTHYQTNTDKSEDPGDEDCTPEGTTGTPPGHWFGATGNSGGFQDWEFDLSAVRGQGRRGLDLLHPGLRQRGPRRLRRRRVDHA